MGSSFRSVRGSGFALCAVLAGCLASALFAGEAETIFFDDFESGAVCTWSTFVSPTIPGGCVIDGVCYAPGATDPLNQGCRTCNPAVSQTSWQVVNNGGNCSDANPCTTGDTCNSGVCQPTGVDSCDDGVDCTDDSCDPGFGCFNDPQDTLCDDLLACTLNSCAVDGCDTTIVAGNCVVDGVCYADGELSPVNPCLACDSATNPEAFSPLPANTECSAGKCTSETGVVFADRCDGSGTCEDSGSGDCSPFDCSGGDCLTFCASSTECATGNYCSAGDCLPKKANGQACGAAEQCTSNFCVDGFCCQSGCGGTCESCNQPMRHGFCDPIPADTDPDNDCNAQAASTCGRNGFCNGARACKLWPNGTACTSPACTNEGAPGFFLASDPSDLCNGTGTCVVTTAADCGAYLCNNSTGLCRTSCQFDFECDPNFLCSGSPGNPGVCF